MWWTPRAADAGRSAAGLQVAGQELGAAGLDGGEVDIGRHERRPDGRALGGWLVNVRVAHARHARGDP